MDKRFPAFYSSYCAPSKTVPKKLEIKNFSIGGETTKFSLFADDMTCFLRDKESHTSLFAILESFGSCSGLRVNHDKTEIIALGSNILHEKDFKDHKICEIIKILGVYFGYDEKQK